MSYRRALTKPHGGYADDELVDWSRELFGPEEPPFYHRTGVLLAFAALGLLALVCVGAIALLVRAQPNINADGRGSVGADAPSVRSPVTAPPSTAVVPPVVATTSARATGTTTTTSAAPTTTSGVATTEALPTSGRFSGVIAAKSGADWTITDWQGAAVPVRVTSATQFTGHMDLIPREQFFIGQTVSVFWHVEGDTMVVDRMYGLS